MRKKSLLWVLLLSVGLLAAGTVSYSLEMEFPDLKVVGDNLEISYDDCIMLSKEGAPLLPRKGINLLLPQNDIAGSVNIIDISYYPVTENGTIRPSSRPFPISQPVPENYEPQPDASIYRQDAFYPASIFSEVTTGFLCGHGIASLSFCPVQYNPVSGEIRFIESVEFVIETTGGERAQQASVNLKNDHRIQERLEKIVENPEMLFSYSYNNTNNRTLDYDLLLITNNELAPAFGEYIEFKESTGFSVALETIEEIYSNYTGIDAAAQVRNCIINYYQSYGIGYVILGGDTGNSNEEAIVPHRGFAVDDDPSLPSDMYFSNLDGTWNNNGNGEWGEQSEIDPYAEILVGRMCVDSASEVYNATDKHILYQNNPVVEDITKGVMVGEQLNDNPLTYGGDYKDQIAEGGTYNGYYSEGFSADFNINYFYERDMYWDISDLFNEFSNTGVNLLNHLGHSSPTYNMKMTTDDLTTENFTNNGITRGFGIGYSQGCYNGSFDNYHYNGYYTGDCFAEKMVNSIPTGEVACIANSRYGWYSPGGTNSSSQYYDRMFFHGIFGEGLSEIGDVNRFSHEENVSMMQTDSNMRWVCYQTNLFGDPSLDIWTDEPTDMVITHPVSLPIGISSIQITSSEPYTRIGLMQNDVLIGRGLTDEYGMLEIETFDPISSPGLINVSGIAHNKNRYLGNIVVVTDQPYMVLQSIAIDDTLENNNGLAEYGEDVYLDVSFNNVGDQPAEGVTATITTINQNININEGNLFCGTIGGETILEFEDAFHITVSDEVENQHQVVLMLIIQDDTGSVWNSTFSLTLNAPELECGYPEIDDTSGDGNGILNAGETAIVSIPAINTGNSTSPDLVAIMLSLDSWVTISTQSLTSGPLDPGETETFDFEISLDEETPEGATITLNFSVAANTYFSSEDYSFTVGLVLEDFEDGNFDSYPWTFTEQEWTISDYSYNGQHSARSGSIGDNSITSMQIESWINAAGEISFYKKVSCESDPTNHNFDWLAFYIDGTQMDRWDGEDPWSQESYYVTEGLHEFEWRYRKDQAVSSGSDAGWIDYIIFPPMGPPPSPELMVDTQEISLELLPDAETSESITLENLGVGELDYSLQIVDTTEERELSGSSLSCSTGSYSPGETTGWIFELCNGSDDGEEIVEVMMDFPEGITVNIATGFYGGSSPLMPDGNTGNGAELNWYSYPGILAEECATAGVNLTIDSAFTGEVELYYELTGNEGSIETGSVFLFSLGIGWCNLSHNTGILDNFEEEEVSLFFNSTGFSAGLYTADLIVSDERNTFIIPVTMTVENTPATDNDLPGITQFMGAYPNPFNPETNLKFKLSQRSNIKLDIYNVRGQLVSSLVDDLYNPGVYTIHWDGSDINGKTSASGVYFCRFTARSEGLRKSNNGNPSDYSTVTKIALMK